MKQILIFLLALTLLPMFAFGQRGIFQYTEQRDANLTSTQTKLLEAIQNQPKTKNIWLMNIQSDMLEISTSAQLLINLPNERTIEVQRLSAKSINNSQIYWTGEIDNEISEVSLLITENDITGMIRSKNSNFEVYPFRETGFHLLVEIDLSKFAKKNHHR